MTRLEVFFGGRSPGTRTTMDAPNPLKRLGDVAVIPLLMFSSTPSPLQFATRLLENSWLRPRAKRVSVCLPTLRIGKQTERIRYSVCWANCGKLDKLNYLFRFVHLDLVIKGTCSRMLPASFCCLANASTMPGKPPMLQDTVDSLKNLSSNR